MPFYLLKRTDEPGYDEFDSCVVRADDPKHARLIARNSIGYTAPAWEDAAFTTCEELNPDRGCRLVLSSFRSG